MNHLNSDDEIAQLHKKISALELKLSQTQQKLNTCLEQSFKASSATNVTTEEQQALIEEEHKQQNKLFSICKLCEANWSDIPQSKTSPAFKMLNTPVTFEMFDRYCAETGEQPPGDNGWGRENRPVVNVNYQDAITYARWLSEKTGWHCQLPTEEQWEYSCRAGTVTHYWYGDSPDPRMMVMGTGKTMPTPGTRLANPWDLYDMHGNVWEWTSSSKGGEYILCGGSWYNKANWLTSTARNISYPNFSNDNWGFRLIRMED